MTKIQVRANLGTPERPNSKTREITGNISEKLLALFLASSKDELSVVAGDIGIHGNSVFNEKKQTAVVHYSIDDAIKLLIELKERAVRANNNKRDWLTKIDTDGDEIKIVLETGSEITFVKK